MFSALSSSPKDYRRFDSAINLALQEADDFQYGPWWLRCIEFHFDSRVYKAGESFGWHCHKEIQVELPLSGRFRFSLKPGKPAQIQGGQLFVIPPETQHRWDCIETGVMLGVSLAVLPKADALAFPISPMLVKGVSKRGLPESLLEGFLDELKEVDGAGKSSSDRLSAWIFLIIDRLIREVVRIPSALVATELPQETISRNQRMVSTLMRYIEANIGNNLTLNVLEQVVSLSGRQIQRLFVEITGLSCHQYIMNRRIDAAQAMMTKQPNISIKEVAYACGFSSPAHFATSFKKSKGRSPSDYTH